MLEQDQSGNMPVLEDLLEQADSLPAFPDIVSDLLGRIDSPTSAPDDFTGIISRDQVLAGKVLKFANSAFYGYSKEIVSLKEAIIILGLDTLKSIVLAISSFSVFQTDIRGYGLKKSDLYGHSLATASLARNLALHNNMYNIEKYFICGLLHDVGKLLLGNYLSGTTDQLQAHLSEGNDLESYEKQLTGFTHSRIGGELAKYWNLPDLLVNVITYHHTPEKAPASYRGIVQVIDTANKLAELIQPGTGYPLAYDWLETVNRYFDITKKQLDAIVSEVKKHVFSMTQFI